MKKFMRRKVNKSEVDAEIEEFLAEKVDALIAAGVSQDEARQRARREFGNVTLIKEQSADEWRWGFVEDVLADIKYALRSMMRNPAFAATAMLTLALGIGANAAIFNLLHAVILRTLPVPDAEQLRLFRVVRGGIDDESIFSFPIVREMQTAAGADVGIAAFTFNAQLRAIGLNGDTEPVNTSMVSGNFFQVLAVNAEAGQLLSPADDSLSANYPVVLSDAYWLKHFARDPGVIGRDITLNETHMHIAGVAPRSFFGVEPGVLPDMWLPVSAQHDIRYNQNAWNSNGDASKSFLVQPQIRWLSLVARVGNPHSDGRLTAVLNQIYGRDMQREAKTRSNASEIRDLLNSRVEVYAGDRGIGDLREKFSKPLTVLMCAAGMVLLIASVNLASLALARVIARRKEIAVRCSVGATRARIISQFLTEVVVLSVAGGLLAIPVALVSGQLLIQWASQGDPMPLDIGLNTPVCLFILAASLVSGLIFGLLPALEAINFPLADAMKMHASAVKGMRLPWGRTLIAIQVMFSFALLTGAILFVRTFQNYASMEVGFVPEHVLSLTVDPRGAHYTEDQLLPAYHRVLESVAQVPGVQSVAIATCGLARNCRSISGVGILGRSSENLNIQEFAVTPGYFATVGMRMVAGRQFDRHDAGKKPIATVISSAAARKFFPNGNVIGQHFGYGGDYGRFEVVGIVSDARINNLHEAPPVAAYFSLEQDTQYARSVEVRATGDPKALEQLIRRAIHDAASTLPVSSVKLLREQVDGNLLREKLLAKLGSAFAVLALALASLGVYGVLSYAVSRRTSEIGIRLALGAEGGSVRWMVMKEAVAVILIGLALGIPVSIAGAQLVRGLLYGLSPRDPMPMAYGSLMLVGIGLVAAFIPAFRASRVDPNVALRYE